MLYITFFTWWLTSININSGYYCKMDFRMNVCLCIWVCNAYRFTYIPRWNVIVITTMEIECVFALLFVFFQPSLVATLKNQIVLKVNIDSICFDKLYIQFKVSYLCVVFSNGVKLLTIFQCYFNWTQFEFWICKCYPSVHSIHSMDKTIWLRKWTKFWQQCCRYLYVTKISTLPSSLWVYVYN